MAGLAALRRLRFNPVVADTLYWVARPLFDIAGFARGVFSQRLRRNGGSAEYDGIALHFPRNVGSEFISSICWHDIDGFEPDTWRTLRKLLQGAGTFLDVGSNIGFYAVLAKKIAPTVEVEAFEPYPPLCANNRLFAKANGVTYTIHQMALSDCSGTSTLYRPADDTGTEPSASTIATGSWQSRKAHTELIVETSTLDALLTDRTLKRPVVMKIDVEDHEAAVLRGAANTMQRYRPLIVCEILPRPLRDPNNPNDDRSVAEQHENRSTTKALIELGYIAFAITPTGYFRFSSMDFARGRNFTDFLLVPREFVDIDCNFLDLGRLVQEQ
jgi:FkbM family methyltransferase